MFTMPSTRRAAFTAICFTVCTTDTATWFSRNSARRRLTGILCKSYGYSSHEMKRLLKRGLAKLGYRIEGTRHTPPELLDRGCLRTIEFDDVVCRRMFDFGSQFTFIQVGAFDGITQDPLRKYIGKCCWRGVMVEPQSRVASQLRDLYRGNEGIVVVQAALDRESGTRTLFTVDSDKAPSWAAALASFDRDHIVKHSSFIPGLEGMIREEAVNCFPFDAVLERLPSQRLDLLQIDTERADGYIVSLFPFDRVRPAIVHWEVRHLGKRQREECFDRLAGYGYRFAESGTQDMIAVLS